MTMESHASAVDLDQPFCLGGCHVDPSTGQVCNGGQSVKLQPQAVEVLRYLAQRPGEVISRHELEDAIWHDRTVGYDALTGTMFKLRKALGDDPKVPRLIETISKRGYRLLVAPEPIGHAAEATVPECERAIPLADGGLRAPGRAVGWVMAVLMGIFAAAGLWMWLRADDHVVASKPEHQNALVVLPFESLGADGKKDYLADGLTDDLTTALAQFDQLTVIARDSAFVYKGESPELSELAARLKVDFVLRGSVREEGERIRVNAQLVDVATGRHVWAERFEGSTTRVFELEDQIADGIVRHLTSSPAAVDAQRSPPARTDSAEAYRAFQLGRQHFYLYLNKAENEKARELFVEALRYDPNFAMAHAMLAWTYAFEAMNGWTEDRDASLQRAQEQAHRAIELNKELPLAYFITGLVFRERGEYVKALVEAERAISYQANYANAHVLLATLLYYAGRPEESVARLKRAMRLNPHHPFNYNFHLGQAYFTLHRYEEAIETLQKGIESNPASERLHVWLAASFAQAGRLDDAQWEAEQVKALNPDFSLPAISHAYPFKEDTDRQNFIEGLRKAGFG